MAASDIGKEAQTIRAGVIKCIRHHSAWLRNRPYPLCTTYVLTLTTVDDEPGITPLPFLSRHIRWSSNRALHHLRSTPKLTPGTKLTKGTKRGVRERDEPEPEAPEPAEEIDLKNLTNKIQLNKTS